MNPRLHTGLDELDDFWDVIKEIGEKIKTITPEQVEKVGALVRSFKKVKKGERSGFPTPPAGRVKIGPPQNGMSVTTLLLIAAGAGLVVYLLVKKK